MRRYLGLEAGQKKNSDNPSTVFQLEALNTFQTMAGVGKLLKQAQKMQRQIETLQGQMEAKVIDVAAGGGAVKVKINGAGKFLSLEIDPEFLKEDAKVVSETLLGAVQDAAKQAKEHHDGEMQRVTAAFQMPGMM